MTSSMLRPLGLILVSIAFGLLAMLLWRSALMEVGGFRLGSAGWAGQLGSFVTTWRFWLGSTALLVVITITLDLWANEELSRVVPMYSLSYVAIALIGKLYLGEDVGSARWVAIGLIVAGVAVMVRS